MPNQPLFLPGGRITAFQGSTSHERPKQVNFFIRRREEQHSFMKPELLFVLALFVILAICFIWKARLQRAEFESQFPPISDAEFVARCTPGTDPRVALKVRKIIAEHLAVEYERIYPSARFVEDLGAD
jgi:hypothetical protein